MTDYTDVHDNSIGGCYRSGDGMWLQVYSHHKRTPDGKWIVLDPAGWQHVSDIRRFLNELKAERLPLEKQS